MIVDNLILEKCLGKGSFGEVFLTKVKGDDSKKYATKKLDREQIENTEAIKYLKNEITILHNLQHPNIVKFVDIKKTKKHYYIVMEYCNGGELSKALEEYQEKFGKPFSQEIVQHFMRQIISAFKYIHGLKIIHRDVKLDNVLLNFESEKDKEDLNLMKATAKIIDFGFACQVSKKGLVYSTLGSPINMDPLLLKKLNSKSKKARQLGYDQKADVWSLGTICYEMLIGKSAFDAEDMDELIEKIEDGTYTVPTNLSKEIISFINGMLQYEAVKRLNCEQLSQHPFLTKEIKDFQSIDMKKVSKKLGKSGLKINVKNNKSIWAIFNADDEQKLMNIGSETSLSQDDSNNNSQIKEKDNCGPMLPGSNQGIPGNPIDAEFQKGSISDTTYSFSSGGIFDS
jgi:serine/threonine protein kinase